jgi:ABC-2 type transport system permease protein
MIGALTIARRETSALFSTPVGWIALTAFTFIGGFFFTAMLIGYFDAYSQSVLNPGQADQLSVNEWVIQPLFSNLGVIALFIVPAVTMRLIAEDRRQRSIELLLTSPVSSYEIALGKFLGGMGFALVMAASTLPFTWFLYAMGNPDTGIVISNYVSFVLMLGTLIAMGTFASSVTENQIVAFMISFAGGLFLWISNWLVQSMGDGAAKTGIEYLSMLKHAESMGKGLLHVQDVVYFLSFIGFFLFATAQRVEALRWR